MSEYRDRLIKGCEFQKGEIEASGEYVPLHKNIIGKKFMLNRCIHPKSENNICTSNCPAIKNKDN